MSSFCLYPQNGENEDKNKLQRLFQIFVVNIGAEYFLIKRLPHLYQARYMCEIGMIY